MKKLILIAIALIIASIVAFKFSGISEEEIENKFTSKNADMLNAAQEFLASLNTEQAGKANFDFKTDERQNWHYIPRERKGLPFEELDQAQRKKGIALLKTALSTQGYNKIRAIMELELVLRELEGRGPNDRRRHPELYYFSIFGEPSAKEPWGWRFEGHHLSLNFSAVTGELSVTPAFLGSNPGKVPAGEKKGLQVLKQEEELGRKLVKMLDKDQQSLAVIMDEAPNEIVTAADRKVILENIEGLPYSKLTKEQKLVFSELLNVYIQNMEKGIAHTQMSQIKKAGFDKLHFAWAGSFAVGDAHYYRIHGPTILIEYDNSQNEANHIHTVWRDLKNDFGEDLLEKHYKESDHHH
ncbi:MAG: DUF3500 domain-containing protein [Flammeovirgaceae bacterium]|nr:DUF3500 domain-containing protein [Flammeovirgaceae bacterium]